MQVYKTTNTINNKVYIGQSKNNNPRYLGSGKIILEAIKKYGRVSFKKEILCDNICSFELMDELEKHYIQLYASNVRGYNILNGGRGNKPEQNNNISKNNGIKGSVRSDLTKQKISIANTGKKFTQETKDKLSLQRKGNQHMRGHLHSEESKLKMKAGQQKRFVNNDSLRLEHSERIKKVKPYLQCQIPVSVENLLTQETCLFESFQQMKLFFNTKNSSYLSTCLKTGKLYKGQYRILPRKHND